MDKEKIIFKDAWFWAALLLCGFIMVLTLWWGIGGDAGMFSYCSWVWKHYSLPPYVGCIEADYFGIFLIHRLVLDLFGEEIISFRLFDFLVQLNCLVLIFYLGRKLAGAGLAGFIACAFYSAYYFGLGYYMAAQREGFILWFMLYGATVFLALARKIFLRAILLGLLAGFAFLVKPTFGLLWPVFGLFLALDTFRPVRTRPLAQLAIFASCCLLPTLGVILLYGHWGYLKNLYYMNVWLAVNLYSEQAIYTEFRPFADSEQPLALTGIFLIFYIGYKLLAEQPLLMAGGVFAMIKRPASPGKTAESRLTLLVAALILVSLASSIFQGKTTVYHRIPVWGLFAILSGCGWNYICSRLGGNGSTIGRRIRYDSFILLLSGIIIASISPAAMKFAVRYGFRSLDLAYRAQMGSEYEASQYLRSLLRPNDEIYHIGFSSIPFLVKRKLPAPFPFPDPMFWRKQGQKVSPLQAAWKKEYVDTFLSSKPRFVIISTQSSSLFNLPGMDVRIKQELPEIQEELDKNYHLAKELDVLKILERNSSSGVKP